MNGVREFNRLQGIDLKSISAKPFLSTHRAAVWTVKPRNGAGVSTYSVYLLQSGNIMQNLETLSQTHKVERLALFDQSPTRTIWSAAYY